MLRTTNQLVIVLMCCLTSLAMAEEIATAVANSNDTPAKSRTFEFHYQTSLRGLNKQQSADVVRVWIPLAASTDAQLVDVLKQSTTKGSFRETTESKYGNRMLFGEFRVQDLGSEPLEISVQYRVKRREVRSFDQETGETNLAKPAGQAKPVDLSVFLAANQKVPLTGKPLTLLPNFGVTKSISARARQIYDQVDALVKYDKSKPGYGNGDVLWVCDSRTGNCTDFHSLFISMARSQSIPAKFEIGFPIPPAASGKIGGYHCWAAFLDQDRWIPVDISEADKHPEMKEYYFGNLTADRVQFSTGRDIVLEPPQHGAPLNYFVYPYAEVDGKPVPREQIQLDFSYQDVADASEKHSAK